MQKLRTLMTVAVQRFEDLKDREHGQGLVEYGLILTLISVVAVVALTSVGVSVTSILTKVASDI